MFDALDKPVLSALLHVAFDDNYYSVPYNLVHEVVEIRSLPATVEVFNTTVNFIFANKIAGAIEYRLKKLDNEALKFDTVPRAN